MPIISVTVHDKCAALQGAPVIVCGNSDYTVAFTFDAEWDAYTAKTARFVYCRNGVTLHQDVLFEGNTVSVPALYGINEVAVGVYAGDIRTSTPARIPCAKAITDDASMHDPPAPDVYDQLMELLAGMQGGGGLAAADIEYITYAAGHGCIAETEES